jgi:hypothetical protein
LRHSRTRRSASAALVAALVLLGGASCRHAPPAPVDWSPLVGPPQAFNGLYRVSCCGGRRLVAAVRADGERLLLSVSARPRGAVFEAWLGPAQGWAAEAPWSCRWPLEEGRVPVARGASLPIDASLLSVLLAGRLPAGTTAVAGAPDWVSAPTDSGWLRARVTGTPARLARVEAGTAGGPPELTATLRDHHGPVPGKVAIKAGGEKLELELVEWRPGAGPVPEPAWLAAATCAEGP